MSSIEEDRGEWERGLPPDRTHVPQVTPHGFHWHRRKTEREWRHDMSEARRAALEEAEALLRNSALSEAADMVRGLRDRDA